MPTYTLISKATQTGTAPSPTNPPQQAQQGAPAQFNDNAAGVVVCGPTNANSPSQSQYLQVFGSTTLASTSFSATAQAYASNDGVNWSTAGTTVTASGTGYGVAALELNIPAPYWAAIITAISGTGAAATVTLSA